MSLEEFIDWSGHEPQDEDYGNTITEGEFEDQAHQQFLSFLEDEENDVELELSQNIEHEMANNLPF